MIKENNYSNYYKMSTDYLLQDDIKLNDCFVLMIVDNFCNKYDMMCAGNNIISNILNCSEITISRSLSALHKKGYIDIQLCRKRQLNGVWRTQRVIKRTPKLTTISKKLLHFTSELLQSDLSKKEVLIISAIHRKSYYSTSLDLTVCSAYVEDVIRDLNLNADYESKRISKLINDNIITELDENIFKITDKFNMASKKFVNREANLQINYDLEEENFDILPVKNDIENINFDKNLVKNDFEKGNFDSELAKNDEYNIHSNNYINNNSNIHSNIHPENQESKEYCGFALKTKDSLVNKINLVNKNNNMSIKNVSEKYVYEKSNHHFDDLVLSVPIMNTKCQEHFNKLELDVAIDFGCSIGIQKGLISRWYEYTCSNNGVSSDGKPIINWKKSLIGFWRTHNNRSEVELNVVKSDKESVKLEPYRHIREFKDEPNELDQWLYTCPKCKNKFTHNTSICHFCESELSWDHLKPESLVKN